MEYQTVGNEMRRLKSKQDTESNSVDEPISLVMISL